MENLAANDYNSFYDFDERPQNPFKIDDSAILFGSKEVESEQKRKKMEMIKNLSLVERQSLLKPQTPTSRVTSVNRSILSRSELASQCSRRKREKQKRAQRMTEFIRNKREVYLTQLLIDQKNEEIQKINEEIANREKVVEQREVNFQQTMQKIKSSSQKIESMLVKCKRAAESATSTRVDLQKQYKMISNNISNIKADLNKKGELIESYITYRDFLNMITPEGYNTFDYYNTPDKLLEKFSDMENDNIILVQLCDKILESDSSTRQKILAELREADNAIMRVGNIRNLPEVIDTEVQQRMCQDNMDKCDMELADIEKKVKKTFLNCLRDKSDLRPLVMLERISEALEGFYLKTETVDPSFLVNAYLEKEKQRRDENRKIAQKIKEKLLEDKKMQALERANKPIKKRVGRPLVSKVRFTKVKRNDDEKVKLNLIEKQRIENLLFGPDIY